MPVPPASTPLFPVAQVGTETHGLSQGSHFEVVRLRVHQLVGMESPLWQQGQDQGRTGAMSTESRVGTAPSTLQARGLLAASAGLAPPSLFGCEDTSPWVPFLSPSGQCHHLQGSLKHSEVQFSGLVEGWPEPAPLYPLEGTSWVLPCPLTLPELMLCSSPNPKAVRTWFYQIPAI